MLKLLTSLGEDLEAKGQTEHLQSWIETKDKITAKQHELWKQYDFTNGVQSLTFADNIYLIASLQISSYAFCRSFDFAAFGSWISI